MRHLYNFILRNHFVFLFVLLEGLAFILILNFNAFQKSHFIEHTRNLSAFVNSKMQSLNEYFSLRTENDILSAENTRLRNLLERDKNEGMTGYIKNDSARRINYLYIPAKVVSNSVNKQYNFITIDKGRLQGVRPEMAVISDRGVVGIVEGSSDNFSTVLPVLNRNFRLSAKIKRNNYFGIIEWEGISSLYAKLREIPVHAEISVGDTVVTSGYSTIFPEGIMVGLVESIGTSDGNYHEITLKLATNYHNLVHVNVVDYNYKDEQETLEKRPVL